MGHRINRGRVLNWSTNRKALILLLWTHWTYATIRLSGERSVAGNGTRIEVVKLKKGLHVAWWLGSIIELTSASPIASGFY